MQSPTRRTARFTTIALALLLVAQAIVLLPAVSAGPVVNDMVPDSGPSNGGTTVTLTGTGFVAGVHVTVGTAPATSITVTSPTSMTFVTPPRTMDDNAGASVDVSVVVRNADNVATTYSPFTYTNSVKPTLGSITPASGSANGGTTVTVSGSNFAPGVQLKIGENKAIVTSVTASSITAQTTGNNGGAITLPVTVTNPDGDVSSAFNGYAYSTASTPTVSLITPTSGGTNGGTSVTITGANFAPGARVLFSDAASASTANPNAASVVFSSSTSLTAISTTSSEGSVFVTVINPDGQRSTATPTTFTYVASSDPTVTAVSPATGSTLGGTMLTITGSNFHTGSNLKPVVTLGTGNTCTSPLTPGIDSKDITVASATSIVVKTPASTVTSPAFGVCVKNPGSSPKGLASAFTYVPPVRIDRANPATAGSIGGASIALEGSGFPTTGDKPMIKIGGVTVPAGDIGTIGTTSISLLQVPPHATGGVAIEVVFPNGFGATLTNGFTYTASLAPVLTSVSPSSSNAAGQGTNGGTVVTVTGTNLQADPDFPPAVTVGGVPALVCVGLDKAGSLSNPVKAPGCTAPTGTSALKFVTPSRSSSAAALNQAVRITNTDGLTVVSDATDNSDDFDYTTGTPAPTFAGLSDDRGSANGGTEVVITGSGFAIGPTKPTITVGGTAVPATAITATNAGSVTFFTPIHAAGLVDVVLTNPDGQSAPVSNTVTTNDFTYTAAVAPNLQSVAFTSGTATVNGGALLTLTGMNFGNLSKVGFPTVTVGGITAVGCTEPGKILDSPVPGCLDPSTTSLTVVTPPHAAGSVSVVITNQNGASSTLADAFTYTTTGALDPTLASSNPVVPATGPAAGGVFVTITGTNFADGKLVVPTVTFGGTQAMVCTGPDYAGFVFVPGCTVPSSTSLKVVAPAKTAGKVTVVVANPDGQTASLGNAYRYIAAPPSISSLSVTSSTVNGGVDTTLTGTNFPATVRPTVAFGAMPAAKVATVGAFTSTTAVATVPSGAGLVDTVLIDADGQTATRKAAFTYNFAQALSFSTITPVTGSVNGGTSVKVTGNGFAPGATVTINSKPAAVTDAANGEITFVTPNIMAMAPTAQKLGPVDIVIMNPDGQTLSLANKFAYNAVAAPTVTSISPTTGPNGGGTAITISGTGFASGATVTVGGAACTSVTIVSSTSITCTTPAGSAGAQSVAVTVAGQTGTLADAFTYTGTTTTTSTSATTTTTSATTTTTSTTVTTTTGSTTSSSTSTTVAPSGAPTNAEIQDANDNVDVDVRRDGNDNIVSFNLPADLPADPEGVQVWRSTSPFVLVKTIDDQDDEFDDGEFRDVNAPAGAKYLVTVFYANGVGFSSCVVQADCTGSALPYGFAALGDGVGRSNDSGIATWVWVLIGGLALVLVVVIIVLVSRRRPPAEPVAAYGWNQPTEAAAASEPAATGPVNQTSCPSCKTRFSVTGTRPLKATCPNCGKTGILR